MTNGNVQQASLKPSDNLKPGDTIRTGRNGRVLLMRGEESILIAPNSVIGLPAEQKEELSTTIVQRAGSILLDVEKRNVKHFEVETPYLAAVVKGTQFRVSVNATSTSVDVMRGQVEVADFKSGQIAQVMPGQRATTFEHGKSGLSLTGSGTFNPIEQGKPRPSPVDRVPVPKGGLSSPRDAASGQAIHALATHGRLRISSALGEVKLNFHKVTHGLRPRFIRDQHSQPEPSERHGLEFVSDDQRKCRLVNSHGHQQRIEQHIARRGDGRRRHQLRKRQQRKRKW